MVEGVTIKSKSEPRAFANAEDRGSFYVYSRFIKPVIFLSRNKNAIN